MNGSSNVEYMRLDNTAGPEINNETTVQANRHVVYYTTLLCIMFACISLLLLLTLLILYTQYNKM